MSEQNIAMKGPNSTPIENALPLGSHCGPMFEGMLSSAPDLVCAFNRQRRFAYANPAMLMRFGLSEDEMIGMGVTDLDYPADLADRLDGHIAEILRTGFVVQDEVLHQEKTGRWSRFEILLAPIRAKNGSIELVIGVLRDNSKRDKAGEQLRKSEARLRVATQLVGIGIYSWDPVSGAFDVDERTRAIWALSPETEVTMDVLEAAIHPDDLASVRQSIAACVDPAGDGRYDIEYRVLGHDGVSRHVATLGRAIFEEGSAIDFIGAAIDVTAQRHREAAILEREAQFRSFADHSSNLIWIGDPGEDRITYRSAAFEKIWGVPRAQAPTTFRDWMNDVHPEDRYQVEHALETVKAGEVSQFEYRIVRPYDGAIRYVRETSFPILDEHGATAQIGGITEDITQDDARQAYIVCSRAAEARRLSAMVRTQGYKAQNFASAAAFLDVAAVLATGCVLVDLRKSREEGLSVPREIKARSLPLPTIAIDAPGADAQTAVTAMKAGAVDYITMMNDASLPRLLANAMAECLGTVRPATRNENADARVARLTPREREVLVGLIEGGTNKTIAHALNISPRTVEVHRAQVMHRLNVRSLPELVQIALAAGVMPRNT